MFTGVNGNVQIIYLGDRREVYFAIGVKAKQHRPGVSDSEVNVDVRLL